MSETDAAWEDYVRNSSIMYGRPARHPSERIPIVIPVRPQVWNRRLRFLVCLPLAWLGFNIAVGLAAGLWWWIILTTIACASAGSVVLAREDQHLLRASGKEVNASPWWALIPPAYLAKRGAAMWESNPAAFNPLWVHLVLCIGILVTSLALPMLLGVIARLAAAHAAVGG